MFWIVFDIIFQKINWLHENDVDTDKIICSSTALMFTLPNQEHDTKLYVAHQANLCLQGFSTTYDSNRSAQLQRLARVLKFQI